MSILLIIFAAASALYWVGVLMDSASSVGRIERNKLFCDKNGYYSRTKHLAINGGAWAIIAILVLVLRDEMAAITGAVSAAAWGVRSIMQARRNRRLARN